MIPIALTFVAPLTALPFTRADAFFEKETRPVLVERCQACHSGARTKGGKLTAREITALTE